MRETEMRWDIPLASAYREAASGRRFAGQRKITLLMTAVVMASVSKRLEH